MPESAPDKAARLLTRARLSVVLVDPESRQVVAECRGTRVVFRLGWNRQQGWHCSCAALTDECEHVTALRLVTLRPRNRTAIGDAERRKGP